MFVSGKKFVCGGAAVLATLISLALVFGLAGCDSPSGSGTNNHTVTFNAQDGTATPSQTVSNGGKAAEPNPAPTKTGYVLEGWHRNAAGTDRWNFAADTVIADITLYAKWTNQAAAEQSKEALQEAGEIVLAAKDSKGADVSLALEVGDGTVTLTIGDGVPVEFPSVITDSVIILKGAGEGNADVSLDYVINDDGTLNISGGLDRLKDADLAAGPVISEPNESLAKPDPFVPVTNITGVPDSGSTGSPVNLTNAVVSPSNATNKTIVWTLKDAGSSGLTGAAVATGIFTPQSAGTATVTATIINGKAEGNYAQDFSIVISTQTQFVPVTGIDGVPDSGYTGTEVDLSAAAAIPANATNKTPITWTVSDAGTTGVSAVSGGKFTATGAGTLTLTVGIANGLSAGTPFVKEFKFDISAPNTFVEVTNIDGVPDSGYTGTEVDLSGAVAHPENATNRTPIAWTVGDAGTTGVSAITGGKFTATGAGTLKLTATIANGKADGAYTQAFSISITEPDVFVAVESIGGVPNTGTAGTPISLAGATVVPSTADYKDIVWSVDESDDGSVGVTTAMVQTLAFTPAQAGTLVLRAIILSGKGPNTPYIDTFEIEIAPAFVPVTDITGIPATRNAVTGASLDLNTGLSATPAAATNKAIVWSVKSAGATGLTDELVTSGVFTPQNAGTAILTATILNGKGPGENFTKDITITIIKPVTAINNVPTNGTKGYEVSLAGAVAYPADATNTAIVWIVKTAGAGITDITGNSFTPAGTGTLTLTATIADGSAIGTPYTWDFDITINNPGTTSPGFGLGDDTSITLRGALGSVTETLSKDTPIDIEKNASYYVSVVTSGGSYTDVVWYLNGTRQTVTGNLIFLDTSKPGTIKLSVEGKKGGVLESSGTYTFVISN